MVDLLDSFDILQNFWEANPAFMAVKEFKKIYKKDKTRGKAYSSKVMWALSLLIHPKSKFANATYADRLVLVNEDYLEGKLTISPEKNHKELVDCYKKFAMTRTQRIARQWGDKLDERFELLESMVYTLETAESLDQMMARTEKLWKQYQTCLKDLGDENAHSQVQGGAVESLTEKDII